MSDTPTPVTREELLEGFTARRASTTLYAIEARTAVAALESQHAVAPAICDGMVEQRERAFLAAMGAGRALPARPSIQQLERYADGWSHLAPPDAAGRAAVARRLAEAYRFRRSDVPRLRATLHLDDPATEAAYQQRHGTALPGIYATTVAPAERLRWTRTRVATAIGRLSPFWTAYALTLTQTVGAGILALPVAMAGVGPLPGLVLLTVLGLVNVATVAAIAESFARTGSVRFGGAFFGRVVTQYLGRPVGALITFSLVTLSGAVLAAYYIGMATTLRAATGLPLAVGTTALFAVTVAAVARGRLNGTIASALVVGAVNLTLLVVLSAMAFRHLDPAKLTTASVPFVGGRGFEPELLGLVFGVGLLAYFGHTAVASGARVVLRRDPSGRAMVRGSAAAMSTVIALYGLWTVAVGGAVGGAQLAATSGTALEPLAEIVGSVVLVPGTVFVVLSMGMGAVVFSLGLHQLTSELVPFGGRGGRLVAFVPLALIFAIVQVLVLTGRESFAGTLGFIGVLTAPLLVGMVPVLLLVASRRRGEYQPAALAPLLRSRTALVLVGVLFLVALLAHGLVIWTTPIARLLAVVTAAVATVATGWVVRSGRLRPTATIELRRDREFDRYRVRLAVAGNRGRTHLEVQPRSGPPVDVLVEGASDLSAGSRAVALDLAGLDAGGSLAALRVWAHEVDSAGTSQGLAVDVRIAGPDGDDLPVPVTAGHVEVRPAPQVGRLTVELAAGGADP
jgi:amino acid permease